jgi:hypothetical protein
VPAVQVAQIREDGATKRQAQELAAESAEKQKDRQLDLVIQDVLQHIEEMKLTGAKEMSFDDLKAMLTAKTMELRTQTALSQLPPPEAQHVKPVLTPPDEPVGRAPNGTAFQR